MREDEMITIERMVDEISVVLFDVFDVLLYRMVNEPETIYDIVGRHFGIHGFRKMRMDAQKEAECRVYERFQYTSVKLDDIYDVMSEFSEISQDWEEIKKFEYQIEEDSLIVNEDMLKVFQYAKDSGKYIVAISDTHMILGVLQNALEKQGYEGIDYVSCSSIGQKNVDENDFYKELVQKFNVNYKSILYISVRDDLDIPISLGMKVYQYQNGADILKIENILDSDIDKSLYKILYKEERGFWYNFGVEIGGPIYMALYIWLLQEAERSKRKIYFLSTHGYNLYTIFRNTGHKNIEYLDIFYGDGEPQTCHELTKNKEVLQEFLSEDSIVFDCDWDGSLQYKVEQYKTAIGCKVNSEFYYLGIRNTETSRHQLHGMHYRTFLFDFYKNYTLHSIVNEAAELFELLFPAQDDINLGVQFSDNNIKKEQILAGILDYISKGIDFAQKYNVEYSPDKALGRLKRLVLFPTQEEVIKIGCIKERIEKEEKSNEFFKYHLEDGQSIRNYYRWITYQEKEYQKEQKLFYKPMFSVVIPVYNTKSIQLRECIDSVLKQTYEHFELILVDDHSSWDNVVPVLKNYEENEKVRVIYRSENGHISKATNNGISIARGDFIAFMDCDDIIEPNALYEVGIKLKDNPKLDFIYSDEDKISEDGKIRHMPFFKPDWSPDLYMCMNYTNHFSVYRAAIVKEIGGLREVYNGSQDYDFTLRFMEKSANDKVGHISKILYHWRERKESVAYAMSSKNYAVENAKGAKEDWIKRNKIDAYLEYIPDKLQYRIVYNVKENPLVSIIIPSKDNFNVLRQCIDSIYNFTKYKNFEIIVIDNGSSENNKEYIAKYLVERSITYVYLKEKFNFSRMCNRGAHLAKGRFLLFLNDDIEAFQPEWMERMLGHAQRSNIGAVGAKLFYPETTKIQHAGVANIKEGPSHNFCGFDDMQMCYFGLNWLDYNCLAVTGACLMIDADKFWSVDGFDETLPVSYNDVSLCFKLHEAGYYNVVRNDVVLYHHESLSRGYDYLDDAKMLRLSIELEKLYQNFPGLTRRDPFLNVNLHLYGANLELVINCEKLVPIDLNGVVERGDVYIDSITVTNGVRIAGWSCLENTDMLNRYIVLIDAFGNSYQAPALPMMRQDVMDAFGGERRYCYSGFECVLDKSEMRIDIMPYKLGILSYDREGNRYISWWNSAANVIRFPKSYPAMCASIKLDHFEILDQYLNVQWCIDYIRQNDCYSEIAGFAYCIGNDHFKYHKSLVLLNKNNEAIEFEVQNEIRLDVAAAFPEQHYLYNTGFKCFILNDKLYKNIEYELIIRLVNNYNQKIVDIKTKQIVKYPQ